MGKLDRFIENLNKQEKDRLFELLAEDPEILGLEERKQERIEIAHISEFQDEAEERLRNWGKVQGITTGYKVLDEMTKGLVGGELIVVGGRTSHGKTQLACNIACRVAAEDYPVMFVTLEMTKGELSSRMAKIAEPNNAYDLPILYQLANEMDWQDINDLVRYAKENGAKLVVIDHLHYFSRSTDNTAQEIGRITKQFKKNAIEHEIPIILISHVRKRIGMGKETKRPSSEDLRDSSFVAQDADIILMVYRDKDSPDDVEIHIEKNRNRGFDPSKPFTILKSRGIKLLEVQRIKKHSLGGSNDNYIDSAQDRLDNLDTLFPSTNADDGDTDGSRENSNKPVGGARRLFED